MRTSNVVASAGPSEPVNVPATNLRGLDWIERFAAPVLLVLYCVDVLLRVGSRPLWFDELISYYVARLPTLGDIWLALSNTADGQPPLSHLLMRTSHFVFGPDEIGTRFPAALLFGVMSWAIYAFVSRRLGRAYGVLGMLFAWLTWGYEYSYEARPYALLMGFCALSFLAWREAIEGQQRTLALAGLGCALVAALSSHYYAALLFIPLGVGELTRTLRNKEIDWPVWLVLLLTPLCLLAYFPLALGVGTEYTQGFWSPAEARDMYGFYLVLLVPAALPCAAALIVAAIVARKQSTEVCPIAQPFPPHERAAIYTLAGIPIVYVLVTMALTGAFVYRYPLAALFGVSIVFSKLVHCWLGGAQRPVWAAASVLTLAFVALRLGPSIALASSPTPVDEVRTTLQTISTEPECSALPVVISSPLKFLAFAHYAPPELGERMVYPADPASARAATQTDSPDVSLIKLAPWAGLNVPAYSDFRTSATEFCVATYSNARFDWVLEKLRTESAPPTLLGESNKFQIFRCCREGYGRRAENESLIRVSSQE